MITVRLGLLLLMFNMVFVVLETTANAQVTPQSLSVELSPSEQEFLSQKGEITFCIDPDWMPFEANRNGKLDGMTSDFQRLFEERLAIPFRFVPTDDWAQSQNFAEAGTCDILPMIPITKKTLKYLTFTDPYLSYSVGIIATNKLPFISGLTDLSSHPVGIVKGYSTWEYAKDNFPQNKFVSVEGVEDGLLKVSSGEISAFLIAVPVAVHSIKELGLINLKVAGHIQIKKELRIGVSRQVPELFPIMMKLTQTLSKEDINNVYHKWVSLRFEHKFNYDQVWKIGVVLLIIMSGIVLWNRKLRQLNKKIERSEALLQSMYNRTPVMLHSIDPQGRLISVSNYWLSSMGYDKEEVIGRPSREFLAPESQRYAREVVLPEFFKQGQCENIEYQFVRKDGSIFDGSLSAVLERDKSGNPTQTLAVTIDVTERKLAEVQLSSAKETAERADMAKTKFLATASHDLRQPLQALNLFLYALGCKEHQPENLEIISNIKASVASLDNLLNGLLDISRLEAGLVDPHRQTLSIFTLMERLASEYSLIAKDEGVEVKLVETKAVVYTDPVLLESILRNLLFNAVKNVRRGKVLLGCRHHGDHITIEVWDNGCGIPEDKLGEIFHEFAQIGNEGRDRDKGLGLGLSIVEKLADLLDHRITVRSWEGNGSAFTVELPLTDEVDLLDQEELVSVTSPSSKMSAFVVEDEASIRTSLALALRQEGYKVHAISGDDFEECKKVALDMSSPPNIILADFRLQHENTGIEVINCLRKTFEKDIPAILLTGDTAPDRLAEAKASGLLLLHKPIKTEKLLQEIEKVIQLEQDTTRST